MYKFSNSSKRKLLTCHEKIQLVAFEVIQVIDFTVLEGHRSSERQQELYNEGKSKVEISYHCFTPSMAIDIAPFPIPKNWGEDSTKELARFYYLAGIWMGLANKFDIKFRWGGDWNGDGSFTDNKFDDLVHFELRREY